MINPINSFMPIQNVAMPQQNQGIVPMQNPIPQPVAQNVQMNGLNAMSIYNRANIFAHQEQPHKVETLTPVVITPDQIKDIKGERIYNSQGTLNSIVDKNDKETIVYHMDVVKPNDMIEKIEYFDNQTGKLTKVQENWNTDKNSTEASSIYMSEFGNDGKPTKTSYYYHGKLESAENFEYGTDGFKKIYTAHPNGNSEIMEICEKTNSSRLTRFDKSGKIKSEEIKDDNAGTYKSTKFQNGIPVEITKSQRSIVENTTGLNPLTDSEMTPAKPFVLGYDPKQIQGEKSYYSNGAIEKIETQTADGKVVHMFQPNGNLSAILYGEDKNSKMIAFSNHNGGGESYYSIEETLPNGKHKMTAYSEDGSYSINVHDNDTEKMLEVKPNGSKVYMDTDKKNNKYILMEYNQSNKLINIAD